MHCTGQNVSKLILDCLNEEHISFKNCFSLTVDNSPVMTGKSNGILAFLRKEIKHLACVGCPCHQIGWPKGSSILSHKYRWLFNWCILLFSSRQEKFQNMPDGEMKKLLNHVSTIWLSLNECLARLFDQWDKFYFKEAIQHKSII